MSVEYLKIHGQPCDCPFCGAERKLAAEAAPAGSDAACASCKYFVPSKENEFNGICRRNPPSVKDRFGVDYWPTVGRGAWCGEYKPQNGPDQGRRASDSKTL